MSSKPDPCYFTFGLAGTLEIDRLSGEIDSQWDRNLNNVGTYVHAAWGDDDVKQFGPFWQSTSKGKYFRIADDVGKNLKGPFRIQLSELVKKKPPPLYPPTRI